ncbi:MAG TPA: hypothetical protein VE890_02245 [Thermoguttaceae bacterium]|nr:hypothetical protein [Thermoguttaceae bacterium]
MDIPKASLLPHTWEVPQVFRDRLGRQAGRQRAMAADGHLLLVLHAVPKADDEHRQARFVWRNAKGEYCCNDLRGGVGVLDKHLDEFAETVEHYDERDEKAVDAEDYFEVLQGLSPVQRAARHLHQTLQNAREMVPEDRDLINARDRAYDIARTAELLYNEAKHSLEFEIARRTEQQAASARQMSVSAHRLNLLAAFFFPIATMAAIFGVNLQHGLETRWAPLPFVVALGIGLLLGFILKAFVTRPS